MRYLPRLAVAAAACVISAGATASTPAPLRATVVAYLVPTDDRMARYDLYTMRADGSGRRRLARDALWDGPPSWSPDGRRIVFSRIVGPESFVGTLQVWTVRRDGTDLRQLFALDEFLPEYPRFDPTGRRVAYQVQPASPRRAEIVNVYVVGEAVVEGRLGHGSRESVRNGTAWSLSADGRRIAFEQPRETPESHITDVFVLNLTTREAVKVADVAWEPVWAPAGERIAIGGLRGLSVVRADGTARRLLARAARVERERVPGIGTPSWSRDGSAIAYLVDREDDTTVNIVSTTGAPRPRVVARFRFPMYGPPTWTRDGRHVIVSSDTRLYRIAVDTKRVVAIGRGTRAAAAPR